MFARCVTFVTAILLSGCATYDEVAPTTPAAPTPTCKGAADCDAKWSAARSFVISHTAYELQYDAIDRIETFNPSNEATVGLRAQVNKTVMPDGSFAIAAKFWCNNLVVCNPNADKTLSDFNRTVAAVNSPAAAAVPASVAAPVVATPVATPVETARSEVSASSLDTEKYIKDRETARAESAATNDTSVIGAILAEDCVWILDGRKMDKAGAVVAARAASTHIASNHLDYATVRVFGDAAVVEGTDTWTRDNHRTGQLVWTDTWIRRGGTWQIVARQGTLTGAR